MNQTYVLVVFDDLNFMYLVPDETDEVRSDAQRPQAAVPDWLDPIKPSSNCLLWNHREFLQQHFAILNLAVPHRAEVDEEKFHFPCRVHFAHHFSSTPFSAVVRRDPHSDHHLV